MNRFAKDKLRVLRVMFQKVCPSGLFTACISWAYGTPPRRSPFRARPSAVLASIRSTLRRTAPVHIVVCWHDARRISAAGSGLSVNAHNTTKRSPWRVEWKPSVMPEHVTEVALTLSTALLVEGVMCAAVPCPISTKANSVPSLTSLFRMRLALQTLVRVDLLPS